MDDSRSMEPSPRSGSPAEEMAIRVHARMVQRAMEESGIPARYLRATTERHMPESEGMGLYISGPIGTGKTWTACALARQAIAEGRPVRFATMGDIQQEARSCYDGNGSEEETLRSYTGCQLLVLDDLGKESMTEWGQRLLFEVVDGRYREMRRTVCTSNYSLPELAARLSDRSDDALAASIASRLAGMCAQVRMEGTDRRLAGE